MKNVLNLRDLFIMTRDICREKQGEECVGAFNQTLNQTDPEKAVFQRPLPSKIIQLIRISSCE